MNQHFPHRDDLDYLALDSDPQVQSHGILEAA
jgi:hypothetical protein